MVKTTNAPVSESAPHAGGSRRFKKMPVCPRCASPLFRIPRRFVDRLISLIVPVQRFRCSAQREDLTCAWEGILSPPPVGKAEEINSLPLKLSASPNTTNRPASKLRARARSRYSRGKKIKGSPGVIGSPIPEVTEVAFEEMAEITLDAIGDAVLVVEPNGTLIYLNTMAETLTGWSSDTAIGRPVEEVFRIVDSKSGERVPSPSAQAIREERTVALSLGTVLVRPDGTGLAIEDKAAPIYNHHGKVAGAVIVFHDARQSRVEIQKMSHLAQHDFLTGLPNRVLFMEQVAQAIGMAKRHHKQVALLFLDLDCFKQINDSFGHAFGDRLLKEIAADIAGCVRATDSVCRHGGDEFLVLLTEIENVEDSTRVAEKLLARFAEPRLIDGRTLRITLSVGISVYPDHGLDADTLIDKADAAMYVSKQKGRNGYKLCAEQR